MEVFIKKVPVCLKMSKYYPVNLNWGGGGQALLQFFYSKITHNEMSFEC